MRKIGRRIWFLFRRNQLERELACEMEAHREMMPPERRANFGNASRLREEARDAWTWAWLEQFVQDLSYGARVLSRAPGFVLGAVLVLALGVGVNLSEFEIFDAMIFHRLTIRDADTCLQFVHVSRQGSRLGFPSGAIEFYRAQNHSFEWLVSEDTSIDVATGEDTGLRSNFVSSNYFGSLGIVPAWGRLLDAHDAEPGAPPVAVLGYSYWQTRWGADPNVVGRVVRVNNQAVQIVGILPYTFEGLMPRNTMWWFPITARPLLLPGSAPTQQDLLRPSVAMYGKLKPGVSQAAGEAELTALTQELVARESRAFDGNERIQAHLLQAGMRRSLFGPAAVFIVMILLVLLSACANLANMLLARGLARQREISIRLSIGASRARVIRQLMTENLLLAVLGAIAGVAFGGASTKLLLYVLRAPANFHVSMSPRVAVFGLVLTLLSALVFGLPSALQTVRLNSRKIHLRQGLVGVQVAVSCLLLIASGVLAHNGVASASVELSFDYKNMVMVAPQLYGRDLTIAAAQQKLDALEARLSALPGLDGMTTCLVPPLSGRLMMESFPGLPRVYKNMVAPSYFAVMNLPVVRGRTFLAEDSNAVIVSESAARAFWPNQEPVGKTWTISGRERTVVGVVKDSGANLMTDADSVEAYLPIGGERPERAALVLRTKTDPAALARMIPAIAGSMNEVVGVSLMRASRDSYLEAQMRMIKLIGSIGAVATALAAAGMFALVAFAVAQRRRELGIRMAIGARPRHVLGMLATQHARPTVVGVVAGAVLAAIVARLVQSVIVLVHRESLDLIGFAGGIGGFLVVAALATLSPALRALRIDPSTTLREE